MLISEKQQKANQQNAQLSTGPKTPEGKEAVRFNALTYGLRTLATVLPDENAADYYRLWNELVAEWQPQTRTERCYLETMVTSQWLLARIAMSEKNIYMHEYGEQQFKMLAYVAKQRAQLERSFRTAIEDLKQSQKERRQQPTQTAQPAAAPAPKPAATHTPPPDYVMSEGAEAHPILCSPNTPDTR